MVIAVKIMIGEMNKKMNETTIERIQNTEYCCVYTAENKFINALNKLAEQYPDDVDIQYVNPDGSMVAHVPYNWFRFVKPPTKRNLTDEQKAALSQRAANLHKSKKKELK